LWIGNKGQITSVHYDFSTGDPGMDGLHAVIKGRKRFLLFDPQLNEKCFRRRCVWGRFHNAEIDHHGLPDPKLHPEFANAKCISIELQAGDLLYIPKLWWHHVTTLEPSISVNFWFQHLESEKLKLTRNWPSIQGQLESVAKMQISKDKMRNVLQFYGLKVSDADVQSYMDNIIKFMLLPQFIDTFANGTKAPWMVTNPESAKFSEDIKGKVKKWIIENIKP